MGFIRMSMWRRVVVGGGAFICCFAFPSCHQSERDPDTELHAKYGEKNTGFGTIPGPGHDGLRHQHIPLACRRGYRRHVSDRGRGRIE